MVPMVRLCARVLGNGPCTINLWPFFLVVWHTGAITEYSCTESDHRHHGEERESSFQLNYSIYGLSSCWFGIQGPVPSTRAQSLTIGTMARKGKASVNQTT